MRNVDMEARERPRTTPGMGPEELEENVGR
jgi:hypothetical protein